MLRRHVRVGTVAVVVCFGIVTAGNSVSVYSEQRASATREPTLPTDVHAEYRNRLSDRFSSASSVEDVVAEIQQRGMGHARWASPLGRGLTELGILVTGREYDQPYEWSLHELEAVAVGLDPAVIDVVRERRTLTGLGDREEVIIQFGRELYGDHHVSSETYARAVTLLGETNLIDLVDLMARYAGIAVRLTAFNQHMPPEWLQLLPLPFEQTGDIDPESRSRLSLRRSTPSQPQGERDLYGRTLSPEGTGQGHIARHGAGFDSLIGSVGKPLVDLSILLTARALDSQYAWSLSEVTARQDGLSTEVIDVVRNEGVPTGLEEQVVVLIEFARELFEDRNVSPETYQRAVTLFGERDLVDLVIVMGQWTGEITMLTAFDQQLPAGVTPTLSLP